MSTSTDIDNRDIWFFFRGYLTEDIFGGVATSLKSRLSNDDVDKKVARGSFYIFVELVQNILRYSDERETVVSPADAKELRFGMFAVGRHKEGMFVTTENLIKVERIEALKAQLSKIQALDADGLKQLYKNSLRKEPPQGSKGAGVGFVEIARKATLGFEFSFADVDDKYSNFTFTAYL